MDTNEEDEALRAKVMLMWTDHTFTVNLKGLLQMVSQNNKEYPVLHQVHIWISVRFYNIKAIFYTSLQFYLAEGKDISLGVLHFEHHRETSTINYWSYGRVSHIEVNAENPQFCYVCCHNMTLSMKSGVYHVVGVRMSWQLVKELLVCVQLGKCVCEYVYTCLSGWVCVVNIRKHVRIVLTHQSPGSATVICIHGILTIIIIWLMYISLEPGGR